MHKEWQTFGILDTFLVCLLSSLAGNALVRSHHVERIIVSVFERESLVDRSASVVTATMASLTTTTTKNPDNSGWKSSVSKFPQ